MNLEELRRENAKLNALLDNSVSIVSHSFSTPYDAEKGELKARLQKMTVGDLSNLLKEARKLQDEGVALENIIEGAME